MYISIRIYTYICIYTYIYTHTLKKKHKSTCIYICLKNTRVHIYTYTHSIHKYMHVYTHSFLRQAALVDATFACAAFANQLALMVTLGASANVSNVPTRAQIRLSFPDKRASERPDVRTARSVVVNVRTDVLRVLLRHATRVNYSLFCSVAAQLAFEFCPRNGCQGEVQGLSAVWTGSVCVI